MTGDRTEALELRLERLLDARRSDVWRCWSEARLLERWFAPPTWKAEVKAMDQRPGGASHVVLHGRNGETSDGVGIYLEAAPEQRLVFTNAFTAGWIPALDPAVVPLMTTFVELSDDGGRTRFVVRALHWTEEARNRHEAMGFHDNWELAAGRLEAIAGSLRQAEE